MENQIGKIFNVMGKLEIVAGVFASIATWIAVGDEYGGVICFVTVLAVFSSSFISGMLFIGFSEVIFLLQENLNANKVTSVQTRVEKNIETDELPEI